MARKYKLVGELRPEIAVDTFDFATEQFVKDEISKKAEELALSREDDYTQTDNLHAIGEVKTQIIRLIDGENPDGAFKIYALTDPETKISTLILSPGGKGQIALDYDGNIKELATKEYVDDVIISSLRGDY